MIVVDASSGNAANNHGEAQRTTLLLLALETCSSDLFLHTISSAAAVLYFVHAFRSFHDGMI